MQTETLSDHLYLSTYREMLDHARESNSLLVLSGQDAPKPSMSVVDVQRYRKEIHVQGFHLRGDANFVLRTQSMFQLKEDEGDQSGDDS